MMINHVWTVICSRAVTDRETNNVSLQNVIEQFKVPGEPQPDGVIDIPFDVITLWIRADENVPAKANTKLTIISPSKQNIKTFEIDIDLSNHDRFRGNARFNGMPAPESGRYLFQISIQQENSEEWNVVAEIPLFVKFEPPEQEEN